MRGLIIVLVAQSCLTLCDSMDCVSMGFSRQEYWSGRPFPSRIIKEFKRELNDYSTDNDG